MGLYASFCPQVCTPIAAAVLVWLSQQCAVCYIRQSLVAACLILEFP